MGGVHWLRTGCVRRRNVIPRPVSSRAGRSLHWRLHSQGILTSCDRQLFPSGWDDRVLRMDESDQKNGTLKSIDCRDLRQFRQASSRIQSRDVAARRRTPPENADKLTSDRIEAAELSQLPIECGEWRPCVSESSSSARVKRRPIRSAPDAPTPSTCRYDNSYRDWEFCICLSFPE